MKQPEFNFEKAPDLNAKEGRRLRDEGIDRAVAHANKENPGWSDKVYDLFVNKFLLNTNGPFLMEEFRSFCAQIDFDFPPDSRAFGAIPKRAKKEGLIKSVGTRPAKSKKSHMANYNIWIQIKPSERKK